MSRSPTPVPRPTRVSVLGGNGATYDVFEVVSYEANKLLVKGPLLFEIGEQLKLKVERDGNITELKVRVDSHAGTGDDVLTVITVVESQAIRRMVSG